MSAPTKTPTAPGLEQARLRSLFTTAGRSRLAVAALSHPIRTIAAVYVASRLVALGAMWVAATWFQNPAGVGHLDPTVGDLIGLWDSEWYERIATQGYPVPLPADPNTGKLTYSAWAFYPLFPFLVKGLMTLGLPFTAAAVGLNVILGGVGAVLIWALFRHGLHAEPQPGRERLALVAACLWCFYPATGVMLKPYTEPLAVVLVAASLLYLMRRRYAVVAAIAVPLGFTRGVAAAMGCAALIHLVVRIREDREAGVAPLRGQRFTAALMLVVTGLSGIAWPVVVGVVSGIPTAFFDVQEAWGQKPASGPFVLWLEWAWDARGLAGLLVLIALCGTYFTLILGRHGRWIPVEVRAWAVAYPLYLFAVVRPITSMWRFLLLDFPIAALLASVAMRTSTGERIVKHWRRRVAVLLVPVLAGLLWWTCALLTYTPWGSRPP
ncbi:membrane protein [Knoellia sinensis KCTC 19936]|uniref:Membrane protein n=1 Tax=Knoellia sinensis KCTC 19936 TaxID=1385520 RepID=A0A0A0J920_9MICO|nr:hypothetical protein [Knoellia sinensis]KGN33658.1 membrane protein [Knoellia sinensis KCTC 19936]